MMMSVLGIQIQAVDALSIIKPYNSGYNHGCSDVKISDFSDRYINQPGKQPNFHTDECMVDMMQAIMHVLSWDIIAK